MAANMKAVKLRIKSVKSTMQITKAMELVAASKLRRAKERAERSKPYFDILHKALTEIANGNTDFSSPYAQKAKSDVWCYVVIAGDRGFAGGYNGWHLEPPGKRGKRQRVLCFAYWQEGCRIL